VTLKGVASGRQKKRPRGSGRQKGTAAASVVRGKKYMRGIQERGVARRPYSNSAASPYAERATHEGATAIKKKSCSTDGPGGVRQQKSIQQGNGRRKNQDLDCFPTKTRDERQEKDDPKALAKTRSGNGEQASQERKLPERTRGNVCGR